MLVTSHILQHSCLFVKGLLRHFFYAMKANEEFVTYADMQKKVEKILSDKEEKTPSKK